MAGSQAAREKTTFTLAELARRLGATLEQGDGAIVIAGLAILGSAGPDEISFVASDKMLDAAAESRAGALVLPEGIAAVAGGRGVLRVPEIWEAVCRLIDLFAPVPPVAVGIDPTARIGEGAQLGPGVALGAHVAIGNRVQVGARVAIGSGSTIGDDTVIGDDCIIHPGVHISYRIQIGQRVIFQSGAVIGGDGFKFEWVQGAWKKIPQVGTVVIEDDVEVGANSTIDRAFLEETRIGRGTKIDNLVQIGHNVHVGPHNLFCSQVGISGSVRLGAGCILAGKVGVKDNITIGNGVQAAATSAIKDDIADGQIIIGQPAIPMGEWGRMYAASRKGPEVLKRLRALEGKVEKLEGGK